MKKVFFTRSISIFMILLLMGISTPPYQSKRIIKSQESPNFSVNSMKSLFLSTTTESSCYASFYDIKLTTESPNRTFEVNSTVEELGLFSFYVRQDVLKNKKTYDVEWNDESEYVFLLNKSSARTSNNAATDVNWEYYFSKNNASNTQPLFITISLREGFNNIPFTISFYYNIHHTTKLTLEDPKYTLNDGFAHDIQYFNDTRVMIVSIASYSTSNVIFHVEGGYIEDNKDYILTPNQTFIHFMKLRLRNESEITENSYSLYSFPFYSFELTNIDGNATVHHCEFNYVEDPSVHHGSILTPLILILSLLVILLMTPFLCCFIISVDILFDKWRSKRKKEHIKEKS